VTAPARPIFDENQALDEIERSGSRGQYVCRHKHLRGRQRCLGCGRTADEIAFDEDMT
jgi:hypothetical protein